jgi:hypothetical protein
MLMLAGASLVVDGGLPARSRGTNLATVETLVGFVLAVAGWLLRRAALAKPEETNIDSDRD